MILWDRPAPARRPCSPGGAGRQCGVHLAVGGTGGIKDIRAVVEQARSLRGTRDTVLFLDEVHRFNKSQQDTFLPYVEDGTLIFVGATTENPSFEVNNALLSRARVYVLKSIDAADLANCSIGRWPIRSADWENSTCRSMRERASCCSPRRTATLAAC